jgi:hypothetical protein
VQVFNRRNYFCSIKLEDRTFLNKSLFLDKVVQLPSWQVLKQKVQIMFVLKCARDVDTVVCVVEFAENVSLIQNVRYLLVRHVYLLLRDYLDCEEGLGYQVSYEVHCAETASAQNTYRIVIRY